MITRRIVIMASGIALGGVLVCAHAQWLNYPTPGTPRTRDGKANLSAPAPRAANGKPDLSGLWEPDASASGFSDAPIPATFTNIAAGRKEPLPMRPWAADLFKTRQANNGSGGPDPTCQPLGLVYVHSHPFPRKVLQLPGLVAILFEKNGHYRQIFTDGRPLPKDPNPSFYGYSSGKWQGDTLVVETTGFRDDLWLDAGGHPLTEAAKVTERFRRPDFGHLEIELTVDDPKAYTAPWIVKLTQHIKLNSELLEYYCENEKDAPHMAGK